MTMRPASGRSNPAIMRSVVVLPHPDGPSSEKNSPLPISSDTSSTAVTSSNDFETDSRTTDCERSALIARAPG